MSDTITLPRSVVEQALEALEEADLLMDHRQNIELRRSALVTLRAALEQPQESPYGECDECGTEYSFDPTDGGSICVACLKERLEQPQVEREPVAILAFYDGVREPRLLSWNRLPNGEHWLYTHSQPKREPLTDEQIAEVLIDETNGRSTGIGFKTLRAFARAIERAHGIGGEK